MRGWKMFFLVKAKLIFQVEEVGMGKNPETNKTLLNQGNVK